MDSDHTLKPDGSSAATALAGASTGATTELVTGQPTPGAGHMPQALLAQLLSEAPDGDAWLDAQGQVQWVNEAMRRITGFSPQQCLGMAGFPASLVFDADRPRFDAICAQARQSRQAAQTQVRLVGQGGAIVWVSVSWQPVWSPEGRLQGTRVTLRDTTLSAQAGSSPRDHLLGLRKQAARITAGAAAQGGGSLESLCGHVAQQAAMVLGLSRVGVWLFDATRQSLRCVNLYLAGPDRFESGHAIAVADYPVYMSAISRDELVVATDARTYKLTRELSEGYLQPLGIASMLDAPIIRGGVTVGVLCLEHGPGRREWAAAEAAFADALAVFIGLHLEEQERLKMQALGLRLASIIETTPDLVFTVTLQGDLVYLNEAGRKLMGLAPNDSYAGYNAMDFVPPELKDRRRNEIIPHTIGHGSWQGEVVMLTTQGDRIPAWEYFVAHRDAHERVTHFSAVMRDLRAQKSSEQEIARRQAALERLNNELEQRVAERTRKIEDINRNLETFAFSVSHDLKAPLRGIDGYSRLLLEEHRNHLTEEAQGFIDNIRQGAQSMSDLIDDLLAYSRVGRRELSRSRFSIRTALLRVLAEREHDLHEHRVQLINEVPELEIEADLECLLQILRNLIDNAVKFSHHSPNPTLVLRGRHEEQCLVISVKDNGCGFDMKYHDRIFTIFQRLHRSADFPGTGVGLAIVTKAAERLGGRVWAHSAPGEGAEFFLELPCTSPHPPSASSPHLSS